MSWSVWTDSTPVDDLDAAVDAAKERSAAQLTSEESKDQLAAAYRAAKSMLESGAIGSPSFVRLNLSGHANTLHEDAEGMAQESVSATVSVAKAPVAEPA